MLVLGVARNAFEADENIFKAGEVAAGDSDAAKSFQESGKQRAGFGAFLLGESRERALAEVLGNLIGPERFKKRSEFAEARGNHAAGGGIRVLQAARVVEENGASFAAWGVGAGFDQKVHRLANGGDGDTPDVRATEHGGFFARRKLKPEAL